MSNPGTSSNTPRFDREALENAYFTAIRVGDGRAAAAVAASAIRSGVSPVQLALDVFVPALIRVGILWHEGKLNVAEEHLATQITYSLIERLRPHVKRRVPLNRRAVVTTVEGELHGLGARLAAEILYQDGWDVDYLGASTPTRDLVEYVRQKQAPLVVLSVALSEHLGTAQKEIDALHGLGHRPHVVVGGPAAASAEGRNAVRSADAMVSDLRDLATAARTLAGRVPGDALEDCLVVIGERLTAARKAAGMSQGTLAELSGLDRTYISGVERGKQNLSVGALLKLANALGVGLDALLPEFRKEGEAA